MNISRATIAATMILFLSGIGADNCGVYWPSGGGGSAPPPAPTKPFCLTDPPRGCRAACASLDKPDFTAACDDVAAGPLTAQFEQAMEDKVNKFVAAGGEPCNQADLDNGVSVTPCSIGIMPVEWPNQDHDVCTSPPPGCAF
jgi:hypothetical protein